MPPAPIEETRREQGRYEAASRRYDLAQRPMEMMLFGRLRRRLWRELDAPRVMEIGVGTGINLALYPEGSRVIAFDLSPGMLAQAVRKAAKSGRRVDFLLADAERLPFRDKSFDAAVATCVFCSVPDPVAGLSEAARVLKPEGRLHLLEHVRAKNRVLGKLMDWLNGVAIRIGGENINRDTVSNVRKAGFEVEREETSMAIVKLIGGRPQAGTA